MTVTLPSIARALRTLLVGLLAVMLLTFGSAHGRQAMISVMQESGVQRIYETEASEHGAVEVRQAILRMGRAPAEDHFREPVAPFAPLTKRPADPDRRLLPARAPPHHPRAPPLA